MKEEEFLSEENSSKIKQKINPNSNVINEEVFKEIQERIEEVDKRLNDLNKLDRNKTINIIIGNTGAGKSIIYDYLKNKKLLIKEHKLTEDYSEFYIDDQKGTYTKSRGNVSDTKYPRMKGEYVDCPGFRDTRGEIQDFINGYSIHKILECKKNFRLVLVVSADKFSNANDRGANVIKAFQPIEAMFPKEVEKIKGRLHLVAQTADKFA